MELTREQIESLRPKRIDDELNDNMNTLCDMALRSLERDDDCICRGNWRAIVKETEGLIGKSFRNKDGCEFTFFGIVHGDDDYYYGMSSPFGLGLQLLSCVGNIEGYGFELLDAARNEVKP